MRIFSYRQVKSVASQNWAWKSRTPTGGENIYNKHLSWSSQSRGSCWGPAYSGLGMRDIFKVTLAKEMSVLGMGNNKPLDLTKRGLNLTKTK